MRVLVLLMSAALLTGCAGKKPIYKDYSPNVQNVRFPASLRQGEALTVTLEVWTNGGCNSFSRIEAQRTTAELNLEPIGRTPDQKANDAQNLSVPCPTLPDSWQTVTYEDSGTPPRSNPFRIRVNGRTQGLVEVK